MGRTVIFGLRILLCSLLAWPAVADETLPLLTPEQIPSVAVADQALIPAEIPLPIPAVRPQAVVAALPDDDDLSVSSPTLQPVSGTYWIVSSRNSVQTIHEACRGPWGLNVYQGFCNGQMMNSDLPSLTAQLDPTRPVCIVIHGSFVTWESECQQSYEFYKRISACCAGPVQMIFFTWLSDGPRSGILPIDVAVRGRRAEFNGFHLGHLLTQIPESCPVTLIGHSHGCRLLLSTMHLAGGGTIEGHYFPYSMGQNRRYRAILAAGAMDHNWLNPGQVYGCALNPMECLLNFQNCHDVALAFYPLSRPFAHRAIARSGFTNRDYSKLGYNAAKIREVDVTLLVGHAHYWPYYYQQPSIIGTLLPYLYY